ncbi:F510_1955 family glycosylhydrolase [Actinoplanes campanulatus]|uniref:F510_1955 family glycosylhydrolase n=2 Tax=Actinoplanes campanulatus TaxID=113559 RepID=UPI0031D345D9
MSRKASVTRTPATNRPGARQPDRSAQRSPVQPSQQKAARWPMVAGLVVAALVSAMVVYVARSGSVDTPTAGAADDGFGHVHGMAVDHGTGKLYAATHYGLYRIDGERTAVRVSKQAQDLMGFTAAEPGRFLASGHPDADSDGPSRLGLIESTDGGVTWQTMSLSGTADFHGLRAAHNAVYGYNSADGAFMVSTDRQSWQTRSNLAMGAFVVSPTDGDTIVGVGETGLQRSSDGGRTWTAIAGTPGFSDMVWDADAGLRGVAPDGGVWQSTDAGNSWQQRGRVSGEPHALSAHGDDLYVAVTGDKILTSGDGGATWTTHYQPN